MCNTTRMFMTVVCIVCLSLCFRVAYCANITHTESLYDTLFTTYNNNLFPVLDLDDTIRVNVSIGIIGINRFDEIDGEIVITCLINMVWKDERLVWTPSEYGEKTSLLIPSNGMWKPLMYLIQSFERMQIIGNNSQLGRVFYNGTVIWSPADVLKVICTVDVTYFPFDEQTCTLSLSTWVYTQNELTFQITDSDLDLSLLETNSQWEIFSGSIVSSSVQQFDTDIVSLQLKLRRRSEFFVVYIIIPVVFLGSINSLVFVMPASSGERTSVAITAYLSFIVFMEMVNNNVPESSSPVAYIYYYILFLMTYSSAIFFLCIISLRIYDRDSEVPARVIKIVKYLRFWQIKCKKRSVSPKVNIDDGIDDQKEKEFENKEDLSAETNDTTWKIVGKTFDTYCFCIFSITFFIFTVVTFSRLYSNNGL